MQAELAASSLTPLSAPAETQRKPLGFVLRLLLLVAGLGVGGVLVWQGITAKGAPDPTQPHTSSTVALFDIAVLVFREGLECVLVLSAITASMTGVNQAHRRPIAAGAAAGFAATWLTWFFVVGILSKLTESVPALQLQAATGLLAVVVLLVIMNWFFHKVYWGGWIGLHNRKKKALLGSAEISRASMAWGFGLLGFASLYREGFEVVLFLQTYRLQWGGKLVLGGALLGLVLSGIVAVLTFIAHRRLPYRKMLIFTGIMLGFVLLVMVGEQAQEMQQAGWIPTHKIEALAGLTPDWAGVWFSVFPTVETLAAQALAMLLVVGSYFAARRFTSKAPRAETSKVEAEPAAAAVAVR